MAMVRRYRIGILGIYSPTNKSVVRIFSNQFLEQFFWVCTIMSEFRGMLFWMETQRLLDIVAAAKRFSFRTWQFVCETFRMPPRKTFPNAILGL
jgi:hypothetical protein